MADVLFVSKPVVPPWNDSGKNLVRDVASGLRRHTAHVLVRRGEPSALPASVKTEALYAKRSGGFAPPLADNALVLARLFAWRRYDLWHFFFAPNPRTSKAATFARTMRSARTLQTVSSAPAPHRDLASLCFADLVVTLSRQTEASLRDAGVPAARLRRIPPAVPLLPVPSAEGRAALRTELDVPTDRALVLYPGDLEFGRGAEIALEAVSQMRRTDVLLAMACREKTPRAKDIGRTLRASPAAARLGDRVRWVGETTRIHDWLAAADLVVLPTDSLYAKMDYPLVLLEAMAMQRPVVVGRGTPASELADLGGAALTDTDGEAACATFERLLDDAASRDALGMRGRELVARELGCELMASRYEALYDELLAR